MRRYLFLTVNGKFCATVGRAVLWLANIGFSAALTTEAPCLPNRVLWTDQQKQGCVLAPIFFNIYVQCITRMLTAAMDENDTIHLNFRTNWSLFHLSKLKDNIKITQTIPLEQQYANDCAFVADSAESLQRIFMPQCRPIQKTRPQHKHSQYQVHEVKC